MQPECNEDSGHETTTGQPPIGKEEIDKSLYKLDIAIRKSLRYHGKRRRFFDNWHYATSAIVAITGSSAAAALWSGDQSHIAIWLSGMAAIAASLDLVIGFEKRSRLYDDLLKRFSRLLHRLITEPRTAKSLIDWQAERVSIEEEEPTFLTLLVAICENEELLARGHYDYVLKDISCWRRALSDWFSFDGYHEKLLSKQHP